MLVPVVLLGFLRFAYVFFGNVFPWEARVVTRMMTAFVLLNIAIRLRCIAHEGAEKPEPFNAKQVEVSLASTETFKDMISCM